MQHFLFDMDEDPYESNNLYGTSTELEAVQDELYAKLDEYTAAAKDGPTGGQGKLQYVIWEESYNYVVPWEPAEDVSSLIESKAAITAPNHCGLFSSSTLTPFQPNDEEMRRRRKRVRRQWAVSFDPWVVSCELRAWHHARYIRNTHITVIGFIQ